MDTVADEILALNDDDKMADAAMVRSDLFVCDERQGTMLFRFPDDSGLVRTTASGAAAAWFPAHNIEL